MSKVVYVAMVGDILHSGHINIISRARELGGTLIVGVLTDEAAVNYKRLPFLPFGERTKVVRNIAGVTKVVPQNDLSYSANLREYRPDYVVHGDDWISGPQTLARQEVIDVLAEWNGRLVEIPYTEGISSTMLNTYAEEKGIVARQRQGRLLHSISSSRCIRIVEAHSALVARIVTDARSADGRVSFNALWGSSLTDSVVRGKPDSSVVDKGDRIRTIEEIFACTPMPMLYDGDNGGTPDQVFELTRALDKVGVSGLCLEDKIGQKRNSLYGNARGQSQCSVDDYIEKIVAFKTARQTGQIFLTARIESLVLQNGKSDAIKRAEIFHAAGADSVLLHSVSDTADEVLDVTKELRKNGFQAPIFIVPTTYWHTPFSQFEDYGVNAVIYANQLVRSILKPLRELSEAILSDGLFDEERFRSNVVSTKELLSLFPEYV